jgi:WD40 repeat protein
MQLNRPRPAVELGRFDASVRDLLGRAAQALAASDHGGTHRLLAEARAIPGYERDPGVLRLWRELGEHVPRTGLRAAWPVRVLTRNGPPHDGLSLDLSADARVAVGGNPYAAGLWDLRTGEFLRDLPLGTCAVGLSADGQRVVCVMSNGSIHAWSVATGATVCALDPMEPQLPTAASITADGGQVIVAGKDNTLRLWDLAEERRVRTFAGHTKRVNAIWTGADGRTAASAGGDSVRWWDLRTGDCLAAIPVDPSEWPRSVCVSPRGDLLAVGGDGSVGLRSWNTAGECVREFGGRSGRVTVVRFSPDGRFILTGALEGTITVWHAETGERLRAFEGSPDGVLDLRLTPDGRHALSGGFDGTLRLWELDWDLAPPGRKK